MRRKHAARFRSATVMEGTFFVIAILLVGSLSAMPSYSQQAGEIQTITALNCLSSGSAPYTIDSIGSCSVQVSGINTSSNATGIITFSANSSSVSFPDGDSCTLVSQSCSINYTVSSPGTILLAASYGGDASNAPSIGSSTLPVSRLFTITDLACGLGSGPNSYSFETPPFDENANLSCNVGVSNYNFGPSVTGTAILSSNSSSVNFPDGSTCTLVSQSCTINYTVSRPGTILLTAKYGGDSINAPSSSTFTAPVTKMGTSLSFTCSGPAYVYNVTFPFKCEVAVLPYPYAYLPPSQPTGQVTFSASGSIGVIFSSPSCDLDIASQCSISIQPSGWPFPPGIVNLTASYSGDKLYASSNATYQNMFYNAISQPGSYVLVGLDCPPWDSPIGSQANAIHPGQVVSCEAGLTFIDGKIPFDGTITFTSSSPTANFTSGDSCAVSGIGVGKCTFTYEDTKLGPAVITASFNGLVSGSASSSSHSITINETKIPTTVTVSCTGIDDYGSASLNTNQSANCNYDARSAGVNGASLAGNWSLSSSSPTGRFLCGVSYQNSCPFTDSTYNDVTPGNYTITASYGGDETHSPSSGTTEVVVYKAPTIVIVSCSDGVPKYNAAVVTSQNATCSASVIRGYFQPGWTKPSGNVTFSSNSPTGTFPGGNTCSFFVGFPSNCNINYLDSTPGNHTITATYSGDQTYSAGTGTTLVIVISPYSSSTTSTSSTVSTTTQRSSSSSFTSSSTSETSISSSTTGSSSTSQSTITHTASCSSTSATQAYPVVATITAGSNPAGIAYDSVMGEVFVANQASNTVSVISDSTDTVIATVQVGTQPSSIVYDSGRGELFVSNVGSDSLSVISDANNTVVATIMNITNPGTMSYDSRLGQIFVPNDYTTQVTVISDSTNTVVATIEVGNTPDHAAYDPAKGETFVSNFFSYSVSVIQDSTDTVIATIPVQMDSSYMTYDSSAGEMFEANAQSHSISVISDSTNSVVGTISAPSEPDGMIYDSADGQIFVALFALNEVSVISDACNAFIGSISDASFNHPYNLAYDSAMREVFVGNSGSNTVSVISLSPSSGSTSQTTSTTSITSTSSLTQSTTLSTSSASSTSSKSGGGGIPEFPFQFLGVIVLTIFVVASYVLVARRRSDLGRSANGP